MKFVYTVALMLVMTISFQNCSGSKAAPTDDITNPTVESSKLLGVYELDRIESVRFYYTGGMIAGRLPEINVTLTNGAPTSAYVSTFNQDGSFKCGNNIPFDAATSKQLTNAALGLSLGFAPNQMAVISDCGYSHLDIQMVDSSEHIYTFQSMCTIHGELTILDPQNTVSTALSQLITANSTCTP